MSMPCVLLTFGFHPIHMLVVDDTIVEDYPAFISRMLKTQQQCGCTLGSLRVLCSAIGFF